MELLSFIFFFIKIKLVYNKNLKISQQLHLHIIMKYVIPLKRKYLLLRAYNSRSRFTYLGFADYDYLSEIRVEVGNSNVKFSMSEKKNHNISVVCFCTLKINLQCNSL